MYPTPLWTEWQTGVKLLPCPKLRLRAVIIMLVCFVRQTGTWLPPATKLGQGYVFTGMCDSVHRGRWVSASVHAGIPPQPPGSRHPRSRHPSTADTPHSRHPPGSRHPPEQTPPRADTPPSRHPSRADLLPPRSRHPPAQSMLGDTVNARAVRILLECNLVIFWFDNRFSLPHTDVYWLEFLIL